MFRAILETQWKWTRGAALVSALLAFGIPLYSLRLLGTEDQPVVVVDNMQRMGVGYALIAAATGLAAAMLAWAQDHRGRHVYALSLPIARWRFTLFRFGAGMLFLLPASVALLLGATIVALSGLVPVGLHAYPLELTLRFALASGVAYAMIFAIAASTQRTAAIVLGVIGVIVLTEYVLSVAGTNVGISPAVESLLFDRGGVFSVFTGRWMLVDA
jgi:hypothetical protein